MDKYKVTIERHQLIEFDYEVDEELELIDEDDIKDSAAQYAYESFLGDEWFDVDFYVTHLVKQDA